MFTPVNTRLSISILILLIFMLFFFFSTSLLLVTALLCEPCAVIWLILFVRFDTASQWVDRSRHVLCLFLHLWLGHLHARTSVAQPWSWCAVDCIDSPLNRSLSSKWLNVIVFTRCTSWCLYTARGGKRHRAKSEKGRQNSPSLPPRTLCVCSMALRKCSLGTFCLSKCTSAQWCIGYSSWWSFVLLLFNEPCRSGECGERVCVCYYCCVKLVFASNFGANDSHSDNCQLNAVESVKRKIEKGKRKRLSFNNSWYLKKCPMDDGIDNQCSLFTVCVQCYLSNRQQLFLAVQWANDGPLFAKLLPFATRSTRAKW